MLVLHKGVYYVLVESGLVRVEWQLEPVETGVTLGIGVVRVVVCVLYVEFLEFAPVAFEVLEALDGHPRVASYKVKEVP